MSSIIYHHHRSVNRRSSAIDHIRPLTTDHRSYSIHRLSLMTDHSHGSIGRRSEIIVYRSSRIADHRSSALSFDRHRYSMIDRRQRRIDQRSWIADNRRPLIIDHHRERSSTNTCWIVRRARICMIPNKLASGRHHALRCARRQARRGARRPPPTGHVL